MYPDFGRNNKIGWSKDRDGPFADKGIRNTRGTWRSNSEIRWDGERRGQNPGGTSIIEYTRDRRNSLSGEQGEDMRCLERTDGIEKKTRGIMEVLKMLLLGYKNVDEVVDKANPNKVKGRKRLGRLVHSDPRLRPSSRLGWPPPAYFYTCGFFAFAGIAVLFIRVDDTSRSPPEYSLARACIRETIAVLTVRPPLVVVVVVIVEDRKVGLGVVDVEWRLGKRAGHVSVRTGGVMARAFLEGRVRHEWYLRCVEQALARRLHQR